MIIVIYIFCCEVSKFQRCFEHTHLEKTINFANHENIDVELETVLKTSLIEKYAVDINPMNFIFIPLLSFFYHFFGCPNANFGPRQQGSLSNPMLMTYFELQI